MTLHTEILTNSIGQPKAVLLPLKEYTKLLEMLEDLEDALAIKKAKASAKTFVAHEELIKRLKKKRLI
ncbi:MAG: hypothetical protein HY401_05210 [Elusimicrobia bacterium]|nr:hypothetical protein [Elusimicrobiota bacterium]